jgi:hypothetical protein
MRNTLDARIGGIVMGGASRIARLLGFVLASTAILGAGCATPAPPVQRPGLPTALQLSPPGSHYLLEGWTGSGFAAQLRLARLAPSASGTSSVTVNVSIRQLGEDLKPPRVRLVSPTLHTVAIAALTATGSIDLGGFPTGLGVGPVSVPWDEELGYRFSVPRETTSVRFTIHLGTTRAAATEGTSVVVPLSAVPVVSEFQPVSGSSGVF